ncbi:MAG: hypothetical protein AAF960_27280 [Bacteroidota bacterium]
MNFLVALAYLVPVTICCCYAYLLFGAFKVAGDASMDVLNEDESNKDNLVDEQETVIINYSGTFIFIILGTLVWTFMGLFVGKIAGDLTTHPVWKYFSYLFLYFLFLRLPFGIVNRSIKKSYEFDFFPEKFMLALVMIIFFIVGILFRDSVSHFSNWL